eukprot:TRINITY_DN12199_c0_g4_i1.p1 TRINITY_DN12199_c0_g4~~TRINITY_DN12199_c0_g4_i1.p1  ORF type:complete len:224 (-),score=26.06 TRINITY_DN12199_c0_g4_i1:167-838(-)
MDNTRVDGRTPNQPRQLLCELGILKRSDGSCKWVQGQTVVIACIQGPTSNPQQKEYYDKAQVQAIVKPPSLQQGSREYHLEGIICGCLEGQLILEEYPMCQIQVVVQIVKDDGALLSCILNAAQMACMDAGLSMKRTTVALSAVLSKNNQLLVDPLVSEEEVCVGGMTVVMPEETNVGLLGCWYKGRLPYQQLLQLIDACQTYQQSIMDHMIKAIKNRLKPSI